MNTPSTTQPAARAFLTSRGWTKGLTNALISSIEQTPIKFFICDDSTSMESEDGKHFIGEGNTKRLVRCTRWEELRETLLFHTKLSCLLSAETEFRLLNGAAPIVLGNSNEEDMINLPIFEALLNHSPSGGKRFAFLDIYLPTSNLPNSTSHHRYTFMLSYDRNHTTNHGIGTHVTC